PRDAGPSGEHAVPGAGGVEPERAEGADARDDDAPAGDRVLPGGGGLVVGLGHLLGGLFDVLGSMWIPIRISIPPGGGVFRSAASPGQAPPTARASGAAEGSRPKKVSTRAASRRSPSIWSLRVSSSFRPVVAS